MNTNTPRTQSARVQIRHSIDGDLEVIPNEKGSFIDVETCEELETELTTSLAREKQWRECAENLTELLTLHDCAETCHEHEPCDECRAINVFQTLNQLSQ